MTVTLTMVMPAFPLIVLGMVPEYWSRIYLWWGTIFAILSFLSAFLTISLSGGDAAPGISARQFFTAALIAWLVSCVALAIINFTPMCLRQDNGDGTNTVGMCVFLTVIWPIFMSVIIVPVIYLASVIAQKTMRNPVESVNGIYSDSDETLH